MGPVSKVENKANGSNSRWAALSTEKIQDESGWEVVYSDGACKGNGKAGSVAGIGVWWGRDDPRYGNILSSIAHINSRAVETSPRGALEHRRTIALS